MLADTAHDVQPSFAGLLVSIFQHCPQLQGTVMDEVLSQVLPCLPVGRRCPRAYLVGHDKSASIQVTVAMLVQMIQVLHWHAFAMLSTLPTAAQVLWAVCCGSMMLYPN